MYALPDDRSSINDAELSGKGISQAMTLNGKWSDARYSSDMEGDAKDFYEAKSIYSSPVTRSLESALIGCEGHPAILSNGVTLLRNLREFCDTQHNECSFNTGVDIIDRVRDCLDKDLNTEAAELIMSPPIEVNDALGKWWEPTCISTDIMLAQNDMFNTIRFASNNANAIIFGHSTYFNDLIKMNLASSYCENQANWTNKIKDQYLEYGACMRIDVEWNENNLSDSPKIVNASLVFGSNFCN
jgi:hypothetical protein